MIGGGMAGILTAHALRQAGISSVVLEAHTVGSGQTAGTTAKLTAQHGLCYSWLIDTYGPEIARQYAQANLRGIDWIRSLGADCDLRDCTSYLYTTLAPDRLQNEWNAGRQLGLDLFFTRETELPFSAAALGLRHQAVFHPLKLLAALTEGLSIYEHTQIQSVEGTVCTTACGSVEASWVVFACHFPFVNFPGYYFIRQHQERSYVLALEDAPSLSNAYLGTAGDGLSFRSWDRYLLLGGGSHRTGENPEGGQYQRLRQAAQRMFPGCREAAVWSAQDCIPWDGMPYIGHFSPSRPQWLVATGFQKWGMSSSAAAALTLAAIISGGEQAFTSPFSPRRFRFSATGNLLKNAGTAAKGLTRQLISPGVLPEAELPRGHGGIVTLHGKKVGAYRDENGILHTVSVRCPHLGCQLAWNPEERTWDCPCHGSRFTFRGERISGPAQKDLET